MRLRISVRAEKMIKMVASVCLTVESRFGISSVAYVRLT
jgi:hypothetical protein